MSITGGFFNSVNSDRLYNADQVNSFFEGIIGQGVFERVGDGLEVNAGTGMQISVGTGKAMADDGRWLKNHSVLNLTMDASDVTLSRYDAIIVKFDSTLAVRECSIGIKKGDASLTPTKPIMERTDYIKEYCLAYIYVAAGSTSITSAAIEDMREDTSVCGFIKGMSTLIRSYCSNYTAQVNGETVIPIGIPQYNKEGDILMVWINGIRLIPELDYAIDSNAQITLTKAVDSNAPISFEIFKSIDG